MLWLYAQDFYYKIIDSRIVYENRNIDKVMVEVFIGVKI